MSTDTLSFDVATVALKGAREYQEDSLISSFPVGQDVGFAVLADGMGGHTSGHVASALVVSEMFSQLKMKQLLIEDGTLNIPNTLEDAADATNTRVADFIKSNKEAHGMGSTLLAVVIRRDKLHWVSIGDSPLLLYRDGALRQLNKDHSMAPQIDTMVKVGALSKEAGRDHPDRNTLTSAVQGEEIAQVDCPKRPVALLPDDILIVASDGLQTMSSGKIAKALKENNAQNGCEIARSLMDGLDALDSPEQDNATFAVIKVGVGLEQMLAAHDLDALPVLATANDDEEEAVAAAPEAAEVEPEKKVDENRERKAYFYRGQKYYRD